jgi:hypothetical protein
MNQKKLLTIFAATALIVAIAFSSTVTAVPGNGNDPISQVLALLLGIQPTVEAIEDKVDALDSKIDALTPKQILEYRETIDLAQNPTNGAQTVDNTFITSDNPVLFTVYLFMEGEGTVNIRVRTDEDLNSAWRAVQSFELNGEGKATTVTFPGREMQVSFYPPNEGDIISVIGNVIVEGNAGTTVTVHNPPT